LLSTQTADSGRLDTDVLNGTRILAHDQEIAIHEGAVGNNGDIGEEVGQYVLHSQRDGNTADPETCHHGRDIDPEVTQDGQEQHGPEHQAPDQSKGLSSRDLAGIPFPGFDIPV